MSALLDDFKSGLSSLLGIKPKDVSVTHKSPKRRTHVANPKERVKQTSAMRLPPRAQRRRMAKRLKGLPGWRETRNRFVTERGQHIVVWPRSS